MERRLHLDLAMEQKHSCIWTKSHRITEHPELERTHEDHWVRLHAGQPKNETSSFLLFCRRRTVCGVHVQTKPLWSTRLLGQRVDLPCSTGLSKHLSKELSVVSCFWCQTKSVWTAGSQGLERTSKSIESNPLLRLGLGCCHRRLHSPSGHLVP